MGHISRSVLIMIGFTGLFAALAAPAQDQSIVPSEDAAIRQTALDYIDGWYEGDAARMERALHPELAKRMVYTDPSGRSRLDQMSAMTLVQSTKAGGGNRTPKNQRQRDITILDRFNNTAVVKVVASTWVDYLQEVKFEGQWKIINVLWERKTLPTPQKSLSPGQ